MISSLLTIVLLIALSAFFSGTEIAYASANELRLRRACETGGKRAKWTYWIYERYNYALTTILIGNNVVNMSASSIATVVVISLLGQGYAWVATLSMTILVLIFGEIVPKVVAKEMPETFATAVSPVLRALMWVLHPLVAVVQGFIGLLSRLWKGKGETPQGVTEDDIEVMLDTAEDEGTIDGNTTELLLSALDFDDMQAYEIITPRVDMLAIDVADDLEDILQTVLDSPYTRLPVYEESKDNVIGVLHLNRLLKRVVDDQITREALHSAMMPVCRVASTALLPAVLATMRQRKCHMVVVCDEFGGTMGILTMEDVLEELVGDIWDETDEIDNEMTLLEDGRYEASGDMRVHDLFDVLDIDDRAIDIDSTTLGGWAMDKLGTSPKPGDSFEAEGLCITVSRVQRHRVMKVHVSRLEPEPLAVQEA